MFFCNFCNGSKNWLAAAGIYLLCLNSYYTLHDFGWICGLASWFHENYANSNNYAEKHVCERGYKNVICNVADVKMVIWCWPLSIRPKGPKSLGFTGQACYPESFYRYLCHLNIHGALEYCRGESWDKLHMKRSARGISLSSRMLKFEFSSNVSNLLTSIA